MARAVPGIIVFALALHLGMGLRGAPPSLGIVASRSEIRECGGVDLEISFAVRSESPIGIGGLQAFLGYPADLFEPVRYVPLSLSGFAAVNGPPPFGRGFAICDPAPPDAWDDGRGMDVVSVVASAFGEDGGTPPIVSPSANLGALTFRLRPGATAPAGPVEFGLRFDSCGRYQPVNGIYDAGGSAIEIAFSVPSVAVRFRPAVRVESFTCQMAPGGPGVLLSWQLPAVPGLTGVNVYRGGEIFRSRVLPQIQMVADEEPPGGEVLYEVAVLLGGKEEPCRASCIVVPGGGGDHFVRGDGNGDDQVNLSDAITLLEHLYQGGSIDCEDAGDFDDSGDLDLTDAVNLLGYLFQQGRPPEAPFPDPGPDPTGDLLGCGGTGL